ncbi:radical sam [Lucifera butyrica]|uniref:Radical sam n=1 Tax=Lucifera butyrica TaxID=1351585 RepID=A0A498R9L1_9FIRM|nr:radical SAM protein [Lucifera butyrica]VBB05828.1 radical sam [Lucifera butyrica]
MPGYIDYLLYYSAAESNILSITSVCNVACAFCSHRQNPPTVRTYRIAPLTLEEVSRLAEYLDAAKKIVIGEAVTSIEEGEPFTHPDILAVLHFLRRQFPDTVIQITTNGTLLTPLMIAELAAVGGIELNLSLNSATMAGRTCLMRDQNAAVAIQAPERLYRQRISYHGSIVGMPHLVGWKDLEDTCFYLDQLGGASVRLFVPGFTQYAPAGQQYPAALESELKIAAAHWNAKMTVPLTVEPHVPDNVQAVVEGVLPGSPAFGSGIKKGDCIITINGRPARSRVDAFQQLSGTGTADVVIKRQGHTLTIPFQGERKARPGIVMYHDIDWELVEKLQHLIRQKQAEYPAVMVSVLAYPLWKSILGEVSPSFCVYKVPSLFFGGSIRAAGLLTVQDYQAVLDDITAAGHDFIVLPRISFDGRGQDVTGRSYLDLKYQAAEIFIL